MPVPMQTVTSSTLSVLVPLLLRGLKERTTLDKRRTVVVIENMSKLVKDAVDAAPFIPQLLPGAFAPFLFPSFPFSVFSLSWSYGMERYGKDAGRSSRKTKHLQRRVLSRMSFFVALLVRRSRG